MDKHHQKMQLRYESGTGYYIGVLTASSLFILVMVFIMMFIVQAEGQAVCQEFETEEVNKMQKFKNASLYPYMGNWDYEDTDKITEKQCVETCLNDDKCIAFFRHNEDGRSAHKGQCLYYLKNNVLDMVGKDVEMNNFFNSSQIRMGHHLPEWSTDVFVKNDKSFRQLRSVVHKPKIAF